MEPRSVRETTLAQRTTQRTERTADVCAVISNADLEQLRFLDRQGLLRGYTEGIVLFTASVDGDKGTPLLACMLKYEFRLRCGDAGVMEAVQILVRNGANLSARSQVFDATVLEAAVRRGDPDLGSPDIVTFLLQSGFPVDGTNNFGASALCFTRTLNVAQLLVERGATINLRDNLRQTPLHWLASFGREHIVQYMIQCGAEVNALDDGNETPLLNAVEHRHPATARILLANGADINVVGERYKPLDILGLANMAVIPNDCLQPIEDEIRRRTRSEAFAMGLHDRLGGGSRVRGLDENLVRIIQALAEMVLADPAVGT